MTTRRAGVSAPGKTCAKCVLPSCFPGISFDVDSICNYCRDHVPIQYKGECALRRLLDAIRGQGAEYDCLVPVSGGRDSAFVLHQMKRRFDMRVAAFHYDGGFISDIARENVRAMAEALDVHLVTATPSGDFQRRRVRANVEMYLGTSVPQLLLGLCDLCDNGYKGGALRTCVELDVPLVMFGASQMERALFKPAVRDSFNLPSWTKILLALRRPAVGKEWYCVKRAMQREFSLRRPEYADIEVIQYFDYLPWDETTILEAIQNEAAWQPPSSDNTWRFDCKIHALVEHMIAGLCGFNEKHDLYSKQIRQGQLTRDEALQRLANYEANQRQRDEVIDEVFEILELSREQQEAIRQLHRL